MTWFKVDDGFWSHPKTAVLSADAIATWVRAGSYSCQHLTDGFVSPPMLRMLGSVEAADELVDAGLWERVAGGYQFHDWGEYQETSDAVKRRREMARDRQRRSRAAREKKRSESQSSSPRVTRSVTRDTSVSDETAQHWEGSRERGVYGDEHGHSESSQVEDGSGDVVTQHVTRDNTREFSTPDPTVGRVGTTSLPSLQGVANATPNTPVSNATHDRARERETGGRNTGGELVQLQSQRGRYDVAARLNATAHSVEAHAIAREYEREVGGNVPGKVLTDIAQRVDECLASGVPPEQIAHGLAAWHQSPISATSQIPSFIHKAATKSARRGRSKPTDRALDATQIAEQLIREGLTHGS
ncbi:hypothetical protein [Nocardia cyriacigeorgica]|uniref:hypothetical protein n=1 Tax=Nocardia cyriacigeorgica TaxID=135487 RepID=UPI0013D877A1|nr:hypothetical protein [Nocardia cyriacigeorgica]NEW27274.1 hypothetical protein [Nocardia cyriacigeorgica]